MQFFFNKLLITFCDAAEAWQLGIQDPATPVAEGMILFHDYLAFFLVFIGTFVFWLLYTIIVNFNEKANTKPLVFTHSSILEIIWTIIPAVILIFVAIPSFTLLYSIDEVIEPKLTLKVIGHQWYWSYEYSDFEHNSTPIDNSGKHIINDSIAFDSYMVPTADLTKGAFRLLEVDNRVVLPTNTHIRLLVTAADVLHSWAIPSFGIKIDATPGRLTQGALFIKRPGVFYGQCSEICGVNHGFMPIVVRAVSPTNFFKDWLLTHSKLMDTDTPSDIPLPDVNTDTPSDTPFPDKPSDDNKPDKPSDVNTDTPSDTPSDVNTDTPSDTPLPNTEPLSDAEIDILLDAIPKTNFKLFPGIISSDSKIIIFPDGKCFTIPQSQIPNIHSQFPNRRLVANILKEIQDKNISPIYKIQGKIPDEVSKEVSEESKP